MIIFFIDFARYCLESVGAIACFSGCVQRKARFGARFALVVALNAAVSFLLAIPASFRDMGNYGLLSGGIYAILTSAAFLFALICLQGSIWNRLFCCMAGTMLRMCVKKVLDIICAIWIMTGHAANLLEKGTLPRNLIYYAILLFVYMVAFLTFGRLLRTEQMFSLDWRIVVLYMVFMVINLILNNIEPLLLSISIEYYTLLLFSEMAYYFLVLCMQYILFQMACAEVEARTAHALWRQDRLQYEQMKENIETINLKCHDLRHQIRSIQESAQTHGGTGGQFLTEVEQAIAVYDSVAKTGNEALDVILTDKRLHCETSRIQLTSMADGSVLSIMDSTEIYSLFGNLLENAIEYESQIGEQEKRFISLTVKRVQQFAKIHIENYFEGDLCMAGELPASTKGSDRLHGYGLKSVRRIVEKYKGTMAILTEDGMFQVDILFPLEEMPPHKSYRNKTAGGL